VRACVGTAWTALETSCQDALAANQIGYSFKSNLDKAVAAVGVPAVDWSQGLWQEVRILQERRKMYVHRTLALGDMFPAVSVAEDAVSTVRDAVLDIYKRAGAPEPEWVHIDSSRGWDQPSKFGTPTIAQTHLGASFDDPNTTRVYIVYEGEERLTSVFPAGHDVAETVSSLLQSVRVPIRAIRVYDCGKQVLDLVVAMRGS
jgi:hypothetical protein